MKNVLVTGAHGFLGRYIAKEFNSNGCKVIGIGHGTWDECEFRHYGLDRWIEADIDLNNLATLGCEFDVVIHCAGSASVGYSLENPGEDFRRTVDTTLSVLEYIRTLATNAKLIYPSSCAVYGQKTDEAIGEDAILNPFSPYGFHKRIAEELCLSYSNNFAINICVIRFFSVYGEGLRKQLLWDASKRICCAQGNAIFFGRGTETRDWIHAHDAARLAFRCAETTRGYAVINGAGGERKSIAEILGLLKTALGTGDSIIFNGQTREGDPRYYHADITAASKLGWTPEIDIEIGINRYAKWYMETVDDD